MASSTSSAAALLLLSAAALWSLLTTPVSAEVDAPTDIPPAARLNAVGWLWGGDSLQQDPYAFTMQTDCNLVFSDKSKVLWSTGTEGKGDNCRLTMQRDGNLVIDNNKIVIWASGTNGQDGFYYLVVLEDGKVVIYDGSNNAIWMIGTNVVNPGVVDIPHSNGTAAASGAAQNKVKELNP